MSIGTTLAEARESAGLSLEDVAAATRIRRTAARTSTLRKTSARSCAGRPAYRFRCSAHRATILAGPAAIVER